MRQLFQFIYRYRAFFTFLVLEFLAGLLIVRNNIYQSATYFNTSNSVAAGIIQFSNDISDYFSLRKENEELALENEILRDEIEKLKAAPPLMVTEAPDTILDQYSFITAEVINNSTRQTRNYLTIDKGQIEGVEPGMGVISGSSVVGMVKYTSRFYSVVTSLLHTDFLVSSRIKGKVDLCTTEWDGQDPLRAQVLYVPRHIEVKAGDTVVSSGFSGVFPEGVLIGLIEDVTLTENDPFYSIAVKLTTDFNILPYVHVVQNRLRNEKDSIESEVTLP